ncbi:hypothetical protein [Ensifer sp. SL37]|uniref:hypothetical protein n=1 Tax=Ensifer sp. SL37 TaxID=2995137 RepID=UPI002273D790|nr:hypothetical protein [Ensifer sp. SL37]MCY1741192.1 hypothetical protein [Ensifer sp. SL37]
MSYPTPEALRAHAEHARKMADEYMAEGRLELAERREEDAQWYEIMAAREERRIDRMISERQMEAA